MNDQRNNLVGMTRQELAAYATSLGEPRYRGDQLFAWLYTRGATDFGAMTDLGKIFRRNLAASAEISTLTEVAQEVSKLDGTVKYLLRLRDGLLIECVLIPPASAFRNEEAGGGDEQKRLTLCVSTQVGCPLACAFCATGTMGFHRNLTSGEIVGQVLHVRRATGRRITNVVFMGMGEPLLNYGAVMAAADIMSGGMGIAARRVTISTAGHADRIRKIAEERRKIKLALSLHSAVDATREQLVPLNRKFGVADLSDALEQYYMFTRQRVTLEFIFFEGLNDSEGEVRRLIAFACRVPSKINVIPFHPIGFTHPRGLAASLRPSSRLEANVAMLRAANLTVMVRSSAGEDIAAACGQLAVNGGHAPRDVSSS
jgi:23S rRNA (adenine2503-C2)-methyltransferase